MSIELAVVERAPTLDELVGTIKREHELVLTACEDALSHALKAGAALLAARNQVPFGEWNDWLVENIPGSRGAASNYMRLAYYHDRVVAENAASIAEGLRLLSGAPYIPPAGVDKRRQEAVRLDAQGIPKTQIAELMSVDVTTVHRLLKPGYEERQRRRGREYARRRAAERKALERQEREKTIKAAVKKEGGALAEAYTMITRLDSTLGQARQEASDPEKRKGINEMHALRDKMMDVCVRTLGIS